MRKRKGLRTHALFEHDRLKLVVNKTDADRSELYVTLILATYDENIFDIMLSLHLQC